MLEISLVLAKAFAPDLYVRYVISYSDVAAGIKYSLASDIILPVVKRQITPVPGQRQIEVVCHKAFSVVMFQSGGLLYSGVLFQLVGEEQFLTLAGKVKRFSPYLIDIVLREIPWL